MVATVFLNKKKINIYNVEQLLHPYNEVKLDDYHNTKIFLANSAKHLILWPKI